MTSAIAVGDSYTRSGGAVVDPSVEALSWAQRVADAEGWDLTTFAESGAPTATVATLIPDTGEYDVALVCVGTNDILTAHRWDPEAFRSDVATVLDRLSHRAPRIVLLGLVPNVGSIPLAGYGWGRAKRVTAANSILREAASAAGAQYVAAPALTSPVDLYGDRVHPTSAGHVRLANAVLSAMGSGSIDLAFQPSSDYLRETRRRFARDLAQRPARGVASSVKAWRGQAARSRVTPSR